MIFPSFSSLIKLDNLTNRTTNHVHLTDGKTKVFFFANTYTINCHWSLIMSYTHFFFVLGGGLKLYFNLWGGRSLFNPQTPRSINHRNVSTRLSFISPQMGEITCLSKYQSRKYTAPKLFLLWTRVTDEEEWWQVGGKRVVNQGIREM